MRNGARILERVNLTSLGKMANAALDSIRINKVAVEERDGKTVVVKRRLPAAKPVATVANAFFHLAHGPISVHADPRQWQLWETESFLLLNGDKFAAFAEGKETVCADRMPGRNLREILQKGELTGPMLDVAARELRRAHGLWCKELDGPWSHGDLQMSNIVYDDVTQTARLIDFEVIHDRSVPAVQRHADDLLVFLQDMMWRVTAKQWVPFAMAFIHAYDRPEVTEELQKMLTVPGGVAGLWWKIRTAHFNRAELVRRVMELRRALDQAMDGAEPKLTMPAGMWAKPAAPASPVLQSLRRPVSLADPS